MPRLTEVLIVLSSAVLPNALLAAAPEETDIPQPLAEDVVSAWEKAGFKVGWCEGFAFRSADSKLQPGWVPAFQAPDFDDWEAGQMKGLPAPSKPFGLDLTPTALSDEEFKDLVKFKELTALSVTNIVSEAAMKDIAKLERLTALGLGAARVTDAGLKQLSGHQRLEVLNLRGTPITDAGIMELATLKRLKRVMYGVSGVTDAGAAELKKALPKCNIAF